MDGGLHKSLDPNSVVAKLADDILCQKSLNFSKIKRSLAGTP